MLGEAGALFAYIQTGIGLAARERPNFQKLQNRLSLLLRLLPDQTKEILETLQDPTVFANLVIEPLSVSQISKFWIECYNQAALKLAMASHHGVKKTDEIITNALLIGSLRPVVIDALGSYKSFQNSEKNIKQANERLQEIDFGSWLNNYSPLQQHIVEQVLFPENKH